MLKDDEPIGVIVIFRQEVRPFADREIDTVQRISRPFEQSAAAP